MEKYLKDRLTYLKKENARLFSEIDMYNEKNKKLTVKIINENEACIRELKLVMKILEAQAESPRVRENEAQKKLTRKYVGRDDYAHVVSTSMNGRIIQKSD